MTQKILMIEDDKNVAQFFSSFLADKGYEVKIANEALEGLQLIKEYKPDLIILDIMLPEIDGYHLCSMLTENPPYEPAPKVLIFTCRGDVSDERLSYLAGANQYLKKGCPINEFYLKVQELIGSPEK